MPNKNTVKFYDIDAYYHVYNRGVEKRKIFIDDEDYSVFLNLFKRYLDDKPSVDEKGREYDLLMEDVELTAFCLMPNHFHLLLYQLESDGITKLLRAVCSTYTTYFNKKYDRVGPLFQGIFKASRICDESYLLHVVDYIHLNPTEFMSWKWSSLSYWLGEKHAVWVSPERLNKIDPDRYREYLIEESDDRNHQDDIRDLIENI